MRAKITKRTVDATRPEARDVFIWDTETKGFGLKVTPAGGRVYLLQTRYNGRLKRYTIGRHGSPWTPEAARSEAVKLLGDIAKGTDPAEAKNALKRDITVNQLCDLFLAETCDKKKASTNEVEQSLVRRHIKPLLGKRRIRSLVRADIERFMADVAAGKTATDERTGPRGRARVRGGKSIANRTVDLLASMLAFAVQRDVRPDNPARGVKKYRQSHRDRYLTPPELARLGEVLAEAENNGSNRFAIAAIRFLALSGCRKSEALTLRWDWVDYDRACLRLPDSKTGAKVVHLGAAALQLLHDLSHLERNPYVFPSSTGIGHIVGLQKIWSAVRAKAGLSDVRIHDLRHSFASVGASSGDSLYIVGRLLGHTQSRTTQRYAHLADDPVRASADKISGRIAAAMAGKEGAEVVESKR